MKLGIPQKVAAEAIDRPLKPLTKAQKAFHSKDWADRQATKSTEGGLGTTRSMVLETLIGTQ